MKAGAVCTIISLLPLFAQAGPIVSVGADALELRGASEVARAGVWPGSVEHGSTLVLPEGCVVLTSARALGPASTERDRGLHELPVDSTEEAIASHAGGQKHPGTYVADGAIPAGEVLARFDGNGIKEHPSEAMHRAADSAVVDTATGVDPAAAAEDTEQGSFFYDRRAIIPIPRPILVGSIAACLLCGLRKCKTL